MGVRDLHAETAHTLRGRLGTPLDPVVSASSALSSNAERNRNVVNVERVVFFAFRFRPGRVLLIRYKVRLRVPGPNQRKFNLQRTEQRQYAALRRLRGSPHDRLRHPTRYRAAISRLARPCLDPTRECLGFAVPSAGPSHAPVHAPVGCREACQTRLIIAAAVCFMPPLEQVFMTSALRRSASRRFSSKPMRRFAW